MADDPEWRRILIAAAALETGLLAAFARPGTPEERARDRGLDPRATAIVSRALAGAGYLEARGDGTFALTGAGHALVADEADPDTPGPAGAVLLEARSIASHLGLAETLRTGRQRDDVSAGDALTRRRFMAAMRAVAAPRVPATVAEVGAPWGRRRLLDVGGAPGSYAIGFAEAGWEVTVLDLPETVELGRPRLEAAGVRAVGGDLRDGLPAGPWDVVYLGNVAHLFSPEEAQRLIADAAAALAPGGLLAVQEVLGDRAGQGPAFGVMMLVSTAGGDAYPEDDYRRWMAAAGVPLDRVVALEGGQHHLLLGRRP